MKRGRSSSRSEKFNWISSFGFFKPSVFAFGRPERLHDPFTCIHLHNLHQSVSQSVSQSDSESDSQSVSQSVSESSNESVTRDLVRSTYITSERSARHKGNGSEEPQTQGKWQSFSARQKRRGTTAADVSELAFFWQSKNVQARDTSLWNPKTRFSWRYIKQTPVPSAISLAASRGRVSSWACDQKEIKQWNIRISIFQTSKYQNLNISNYKIVKIGFIGFYSRERDLQ